MHPLLRRLLSPAGFVLVGICFLLPFIAVSCDEPGKADRGSTVEARYSGIDLATGGTPDVSWTETGTPEHVVSGTLSDLDPSTAPPMPVQPLAIVALFLIVGGALAGLVRQQRVRHVTAAALGLVAGLSVLVAGLMARNDTPTALTKTAAELIGDSTGTGVHPQVSLRYGFYVVLCLLAVIGFANTWAATAGLGKRSEGQEPLPAAGVEDPLVELPGPVDPV